MAFLLRGITFCFEQRRAVGVLTRWPTPTCCRKCVAGTMPTTLNTCEPGRCSNTGERDGPGPAASACAVVGDTEPQPSSDSNTSESVNIAPIRRRAEAVPLPELSQDSDDMQDEGHTPSPGSRSTVMQESQPQRHSKPRRRPQYAGTQHVEAGEDPSFFGGLESSMLKLQRLQNKKITAMHRQMQAHNANMRGAASAVGVP
ncbi:uncharacterized protein [Pleurodeles waltl]|uniref:uncharacterized protein isoform X2 n=1 Tax=Pleurodeles waltl TaxID=8319 RepID=UPI0037097C34